MQNRARTSRISSSVLVARLPGRRKTSGNNIHPLPRRTCSQWMASTFSARRHLDSPALTVVYDDLYGIWMRSLPEGAQCDTR